MKLNKCSKYIKLQNLPKCLEWLECKVKDATSNLMQWFDVFIQQKIGQIGLWGGEICGTM
jgi:hypothetical protein